MEEQKTEARSENNEEIRDMGEIYEHSKEK